MALVLPTACVSHLSCPFLHSSHLVSCWFLLFSHYVIYLFLFIPTEIGSRLRHHTCRLPIALSLPASPSWDCPKDNLHTNLPSVHVTAPPSTSRVTTPHYYTLVGQGRPRITFILSPYSTSHLHHPRLDSPCLFLHESERLRVHVLVVSHQEWTAEKSF